MNAALPAVEPFPKERSVDHPYYWPFTFVQTAYVGDRMFYRQVSQSWHYLLKGFVVSQLSEGQPGGQGNPPVDTEITMTVVHVPAGSRTLYLYPVDLENVGGPGRSDGAQLIGGVYYPLARERARFVPHKNVFAPGDVWGLRISYLTLVPGDQTPLVRILAIGRHCMNVQGGGK